MKQRIYQSEKWLRFKRDVQRKSIEEIAEEAKCNTMTIRRYLEKYRIR